mgnify:CR=1 FL=1
MKKIKQAENDFSEALLPSTRRQQFKDLLKNEWKTLLTIGLLLLLFSLPYIGIYIFRYISASLYTSYLFDGGYTEHQVSFNLMIFHLIFDGFNIVSYVSISICLAGVFRVLDNLVLGEGILFKDDFILGIKKNWKSFVVCGVIFALIKALYRFSTNFFNYDGSTGKTILTGLMIIIVYLFLIPVLIYSVSLRSKYKITINNTFKAASKFSIVTIIPFGIFTILLFFVLYFSLIAQVFILGILICIIVVLVVPIYVLLVHLYVTFVFDKYINQYDYPDIYRKGLSK